MLDEANKQEGKSEIVSSAADVVKPDSSNVSMIRTEIPIDIIIDSQPLDQKRLITEEKQPADNDQKKNTTDQKKRTNLDINTKENKVRKLENYKIVKTPFVQSSHVNNEFITEIVPNFVLLFNLGKGDKDKDIKLQIRLKMKQFINQYESIIKSNQMVSITRASNDIMDLTKDVVEEVESV